MKITPAIVLILALGTLCPGYGSLLFLPRLEQAVSTGFDDDGNEYVLEWKSVNNGTGVFVNPKGSFSLTCTAPYPIEWDIKGFVYPPAVVLIQPFKREVKTDFDPPRMKFKGFLTIHFFTDAELSSADIICRSIQDPTVLSSKLAVFATGAVGSNPFVQNVTNLNLEDTMTLPCGITDPTLPVQVFRRLGMRLVPLDSRRYDYVHGYSLETPNPGTYICEAGEFQLSVNLHFFNQSEIVVIPRTMSIKSFTGDKVRLECSSVREPISVSSENTGFEVISSRHNSKVVSLSASSPSSGNISCTIGRFIHIWNYEFIEPPKIYMDNFEGEADCLTAYAGRSIATVRCIHPSHCHFLQRCYRDPDSCNMDRKHYFEDSRQTRCAVKTETSDGSDCASIPYPHLNGLAQCRLGGISRTFEFFVSLHFRRYSNWEEAPTHELVRLQEVNETLYTNHTTEFFCEASSFLFADSLNFQLEFRNGTKTFANQSLVENPAKNDDKRKTDEFNFLGILRIQLSLEIVAVHCLAPWWNSSAFLTVERKFHTKHLLAPAIAQKNSTVVLISGLKGQRLSCDAIGEPTPEIQWLGGIRELDPTIFKRSTASDGESLLEFPLVEKKHEGSYTCHAANFIGSASRTFTVLVEDPPPTSHAALYGTVFGTLVFLLIIVFLVLFYVLRRIKMAQELFRKLSAEEIQEFLNGKEEYANCFQDSVEGFYYLPYDRSYEISVKDLHYDTKDMLGSGQFAVVLKGVLTGNDVAIKIPKSCADIIYFKSLLSEIKIMIHIGMHPHIVSLIGACTDEIEERKAHIVVEYCELGSLESYLRKNKSKFQDLQDHSMTQKSSGKTYQNFSPEFTNVDMIKWAFQIADGMEFLASKSIIHADLATRNVLLTRNKEAKISDFGLSKKLYESNNYVKRSKVPLPWRWMALETLTTLTFSVETDVWGYGVTLWEIFTLGDIPFPNENWDKDFIMRLSSGMRMGRPKYCTLDIYNQFIACWDEESMLRPSFTYLKIYFANMLAKHEGR